MRINYVIVSIAGAMVGLLLGLLVVVMFGKDSDGISVPTNQSPTVPSVTHSPKLYGPYVPSTRKSAVKPSPSVSHVPSPMPSADNRRGHGAKPGQTVIILPSVNIAPKVQPSQGGIAE